MACPGLRWVLRHAIVPALVVSLILPGTAGTAAGPLLIDDFGNGISAGSVFAGFATLFLSHFPGNVATTAS